MNAIAISMNEDAISMIAIWFSMNEDAVSINGISFLINEVSFSVFLSRIFGWAIAIVYCYFTLFHFLAPNFCKLGIRFRRDGGDDTKRRDAPFVPLCGGSRILQSRQHPSELEGWSKKGARSPARTVFQGTDAPRTRFYVPAISN
jgi:hypothetical protein